MAPGESLPAEVKPVMCRSRLCGGRADGGGGRFEGEAARWYVVRVVGGSMLVEVEPLTFSVDPWCLRWAAWLRWWNW